MSLVLGAVKETDNSRVTSVSRDLLLCPSASSADLAAIRRRHVRVKQRVRAWFRSLLVQRRRNGRVGEVYDHESSVTLWRSDPQTNWRHITRTRHTGVPGSAIFPSAPHTGTATVDGR